MVPIDFETLQAAVDRPTARSREVLFAGLAASRAAWRARAAEGLLKLYSKEGANHKALARPFGVSADAIFTPAMDELRNRIGIPPSEAWATFLASTHQNYDSWHDGLGYDLEALAGLPPIEQNLIREWLHTKLSDRQRQIELRELEAAAALGENELLSALTRHPEHDVRLRAKDLLAKPGDVAQELCRTFTRSRSADAVLEALDLVATNATPEVRAALAKRVSKVDSTFINSAMVLLEVFGGVEDAWSERPFLFRVQSEGASGPLLKELLARVGKPLK
jgi:hypothetical protein